MKKTLFSLAFVAASGVYVAAANHFFPAPNADATATATTTELPATVSSVATKAAPPASGLSVKPQSSVAAASLPTPGSASSMPTVAVPTPATAPPPLAVAQAAPVVPATPPLPRPRPAPPANAIMQAQVADSTAPGYRDGVYTGDSENAYYGRVQVQVTVASQHIASVKVLDYPQDRRTSRYINSQALPLLQQEVIAANSAQVDTVSGATLTSEAYIRSLSNALSQAGGSNA